MNSVQQTRQMPRRPIYKRLFISRDWLPPGISTREIWFILLHIPLGYAMSKFSVIGKVHILIATIVAFKWAFTGRDVRKVIYAAAYVMGAEVLWRMTKANFFWEYGKYAVAGLLIVWMLRHPPRRWPWVAMIYIVILVPGAAVTFMENGWYQGRRLTSQNLSGPFALAVCAVFFHQIRLPRTELKRVLLSAIGPLVSIAAITAFSTYSLDSSAFGSESSFQASGGFGPNQVSAELGLGVLLTFVLLFAFRNSFRNKLFLAAVTMGLLVQSAMTFSRTGAYLALGSVSLTAMWFLRVSKVRLPLIGLASVMFLAGVMVILPRLDEFTGGKFTDRFADTTGANREHIASEDWNIFKRSPVFGVGPGNAINYRASKAAAHTEFTRLISEHGLFGFLANFLLVFIAVRNIAVQTDNVNRALAVGLLSFSFAFMLASAMRMVVPSFLIGLSFVTWVAATGSHGRPRRSSRVAGKPAGRASTPTASAPASTGLYSAPR